MRRLAGVALVLGAVVVPSLSARASNQEVSISSSAYSPTDQTITVGETVTWINNDSGSHSVTADQGEFDSSPSCVALTGTNCMGPGGDPYRHTFNSPGTVTYHCKVVAMTGSIIVRAASTTTTSSTTTTTTTVPTSEASSSSLASDQPAITQASLPSLPETSRVALPKSIIRTKSDDDMRLWVLAAIGTAGGTTIAGVVLVRRGRVPLG